MPMSAGTGHAFAQLYRSREIMRSVTTSASLTQSAVSALKWNYVGVFAKQVCTFAVGVILARVLGPEPFGIIGIALLLCGFAGLIADFGFSAALVQRKRLGDEDVQFAFTAQIALALCLTGITFAAAPVFGAFFRQPTVVPVIRALSFVFVLQALGQVSAALLKRELRFRELQAAQVGSYAVAYIGIGIPLAVFGFGVWSLVAAQLVQAAIRSGWQYFQVRHPIRFVRRPLDSGLSAFGTKVIATNIANWSISNLDNAFVGRFFSSIDLGFYSRMFVLVTMPVDAVVTTLQQVLFPAYSRAQTRDEALNRTYLASVSAVLLLVGPAAVAVAVVSETVVTGLFGFEWSSAARLLVPLALAAPFHAAMAMAGPLLWGRDAVGRELRLQMLVAGVAAAALMVASRYSVLVVAWTVGGLYVLRFVLLTSALMSQQQLAPSAVLRTSVGPFLLAALVLVPVFGVNRLLLESGYGAPARLAADAIAGGGAWVLLLAYIPRVFMAPSLRVSLSRLEQHLPARARPLLRQFSAAA